MILIVLLIINVSGSWKYYSEGVLQKYQDFQESANDQKSYEEEMEKLFAEYENIRCVLENSTHNEDAEAKKIESLFQRVPPLPHIYIEKLNNDKTNAANHIYLKNDQRNAREVQFDETILLDVQKEAFLGYVLHKNYPKLFAKIYGYYIIFNDQANAQRMFFMEECEGNNVETVYGFPWVEPAVNFYRTTDVKDNYRFLQQLVEFFEEVKKALDHLHLSLNDVKPSNIMVSGPDSEPTFKMIDFGSTNFLGMEAIRSDFKKLKLPKEILGMTEEYMHPFLIFLRHGTPEKMYLKSDEFNIVQSTTYSDDYAFGVTILYLLLKNPYNNEVRVAGEIYYERVGKGFFQDYINYYQKDSKHFKNLIEKFPERMKNQHIPQVIQDFVENNVLKEWQKYYLHLKWAIGEKKYNFNARKTNLDNYNPETDEEVVNQKEEKSIEKVEQESIENFEAAFEKVSEKTNGVETDHPMEKPSRNKFKRFLLKFCLLPSKSKNKNGLLFCKKK